MSLDLFSMVSAMAAAGVTLALSVLVVAWGTRSQDGLSLWGWGLFLGSLSAPAFLLRTIGWPFISIVVSNATFPGAIALHTLAVARFQRGRARPLPVALVWAPVVVIVIAAALLTQAHFWRNVLGALVMSTQGLVLAWQAWGPNYAGPRERGRLILIAGAALLVGSLLVRLPLLIRPDYDPALGVPASVQAGSYMATLVVMLLTTMGFILMQKERALELLHAQATHDSLTGLYNRRAVVDAMEHMLSRSRRNGLPVSLLMLDFDFFKHVNDTFGHLAGDAVLQEGAQCIKGRLRKHDIVGRFGGEEFICLLPDTPLEGARAVAEDVRLAVERMRVRVQGEDIPVTASIGVHSTRVERNAPDAADAMLAAADRALYAAKQRGRNCIECSEQSLHDAAVASGQASVRT